MQRFFFRPGILALAITLAASAAAADAAREEPTGVLPLWVDAGQAAELWIESCFPRQEAVRVTPSPLRVPPAARYLIIKLETTALDSPVQAAFSLKNLVVEARSGAPGLKVALDGPPDVVAELVAHGLAPYVDAYVSPPENRVLPADDPTARLWWRAQTNREKVLATLLEASARGVELVVLEGLTLEPAHRAMLEKLRTLRATDLERQPAVAGIARDRVRFLLDPESGYHYLAVQAEPGRSQRIQLSEGEQLTVRELHPTAADYDFVSLGRGGELSLFGAHAFYLFELASQAPEAPHSRVVVESSEIVDPYEIVVKNQVFQKQQGEKIENLVVDEKLYTLSQLPRARPITREYRVVHRQGQPTDYIWTGLAVNGVPYPKNKLRQGFIFDADQVLVDPLAIELDRTYEYVYLGTEMVDGHPTWKIGFKPTREGAYLSGTVWIDQETHAHRRLQAKQLDTLEPVVNREFTADYGWIEQDGERYWTWSHNEGTAILSYLGFHQPVNVVIDRSGHELHSEGADQEIATAYDSDARIMRDTPEGLRWLTRKKVKKKHRAESTRHLDSERDSGIQTGAYERVLADRNHISQNRRVGLLAVYDPSFGDDNPFTDLTFTYFDLSVFGSKLQFFLNANDFGTFTLAYPGVIRKNWVLSLDANPRATYYDRVVGMGTDEELEYERATVGLALAMPFSPAFSVYARYQVANYQYNRLFSTVPDFVLPADHDESTARLEMKYDRRGFSSELVMEVGERDTWLPWGAGSAEPLEDSFFKGTIRAGYYRQLARNQSMGIYASYLKGSNLDRFSRIRLGFGGSFRVAGYSRQIRFDEGFGVNFNYSGHVKKLFPLQLRVDLASLRTDDQLGVTEVFAGVELVTTLHGPWKTDLFLSLGQGVFTTLEEADDEGTRFIASLSRRF